MFDDLSHIFARLAGGALAAIVPAFLSRAVVRRICEFRPRLIDTYVAFTVGSLAAIAWRQLVLAVRGQFLEESLGQALVLGWVFTWAGGIALMILSVAYFVRDQARHPIGLGSGTVVTLLTFMISIPFALVIWLVTAFLFMPRAPGS